MLDIVALLHCLNPHLKATTVRQLSRIIGALLAMTGRVTMVGMARWGGDGGSYRTVQRFFYTVIAWPVLLWAFFRQHVLDPTDTYILAGDECVVTKAGKKTYGLDRFFSSLYGKPVPGLSFFTLSLLSVNERRSYPIRVEQMRRTEAEKAAARAKAHKRGSHSQDTANKAKPGRPQGSKNRAKTPVVLSSELQRIQTMMQQQLATIDGAIPLCHMVLDGHFGNNPALYMVRSVGLHLISKLRHDAALYCPYEGTYAGRGPRRKYGSKLDYTQIPVKYLKRTIVQDHIQTHVYQAQMWHKEFASLLNVVIIIKINLKTHAWAHVVLFSSDMALSDETLIDDYSLRFQIEFNFRDAKQYWGLEDFMNVQQTAVNNAATLALFMVTVAHLLLKPFRKNHPTFGILDLKAYFRGHKYVCETLKLLPQNPEPIIMAQIFDRIARLGSVHPAELAPIML
jgi:putative transposase